MYLTQMGEIPLLMREEEIALAKKIELTRMAFRRKILENDFCMTQATDLMQAVADGRMPVRPHDEDLHQRKHGQRGQSSSGLPANLSTVRKLLELNRKDWTLLAREPYVGRGPPGRKGPDRAGAADGR